ncbi:hypothetical protein AKJ49_02030 [candidate division MSBL1 archaeon SCGC-AAA382A03]|uniref:Uncharacterized protein n=1 Tax=candidate division MSBL1 archaeon SCGC-AAA382A03 TaxID=1698278 RepID=A0A133VDH8_9EURY|nr:hypothetical protein AKJ49_02030 [candidate division MSBL1 archaeon SCGC-AAA382A03]
MAKKQGEVEEFEAGRINFEKVLQGAINKANQMFITGNPKFPLAVQNTWDRCLEADKDAIMELIEERAKRKTEISGSYAEMRKGSKGFKGIITGNRSFLKHMNASIESYTRHYLTDTEFYRTALEVINEGLKKRYYGKKRTWEKDQMGA